MSRFRNKLVSVCLMAFWLLATQHCGLEAAGFDDSHPEAAASQGCCPGDEDHCSQDGCEVVESGYKTESGTLKVSSPQFAVCAWLICSGISAPPLQPSAGVALACDFARPLDWVPSWQFERRAAAPAHAPDSLIA